ncbi:hypothetical protein [Kordiimonas marina]|uniref:hypothetical protein n=1 Tax=Kordiimonas marina TaxID=2872312 RepID=UPI001FF5FE1B|nr:hypothetical protein [Kordiimonas marina]MCJ9430756.1 hypothetical protein [Kordiimonas marina]
MDQSNKLDEDLRYVTRERSDAIALKYEIPDLDALYRRLNSFAEIYFDNRRFGEDTPSRQRTKKALKGVRDTARKLTQKIDGLNDFEDRWLWMAHRDVRSAPRPDPLPAEGHTSESIIHGCKTIYLGTQNGAAIMRWEIEDLVNAVNAIEQMATHGIEHMPTGRDGRKRKHGLYMLVSNLQILWRDTLGHAFTFDGHKGQGVTQAYHFCVDVVAIIDPSVTGTEIGSQMRKVIKRNK